MKQGSQKTLLAIGKVMLSLMLILFSVCSYAASDEEANDVRDEIQTVAGPIKIAGSYEKGFTINLGTATIFRSGIDLPNDPNSENPSPSIVERFQGNYQPFSEVIVFGQACPGNACEYASMWFLGLKSDGSYKISESISPASKFIPHPETQSIEAKSLYQNWIYQDGDVRELPFYACKESPDNSLQVSTQPIVNWQGKPLKGEQPRFIGTTDSSDNFDFSSDGKLLAGSGGYAVRIWSLDKGRQTACFDHPSVYQVLFSPDNNQILSAGDDGILILWDIATGKELHRMKGIERRATSLRLVANRSLELLRATFDTRVENQKVVHDFGTLERWNTSTGKLISSNKIPKGNLVTDFSPDGRYAVLRSLNPPTLSLWDVVKGQVIQKTDNPVVPPESPFHSVPFSSDGKQVWIMPTVQGAFYVWNLSDYPNLDVSCGSDCPESLFSVSKNLALGTSGETDIALWNLSTGKKIRTLIESRGFGRSMYIRAAAMSPNERYAVSSDPNGTIHIWSIDGQIK